MNVSIFICINAYVAMLKCSNIYVTYGQHLRNISIRCLGPLMVRLPRLPRLRIVVRLEVTHRIHGAAIYGDMDPINIPQMLAYIPYMDPMG